jgi:hypothetical protein
MSLSEVISENNKFEHFILISTISSGGKHDLGACPSIITWQ